MKYGLVFFILVAFAIPLLAGIYDPIPIPPQPKQSSFLPNEKSPFQIRDGKAVPLEFGTRNGGEFPSRFAVLTNLLDENPKRASNPDREAVREAIRQFVVQEIEPGPQRVATHAANLIRIGQPDKAINILQPLSRGRSASYTVLMNLAHAHAVKGDWESALRTHEVALEYEAKDDLKAMSLEQVKWLALVEKKYYRAWLSWNLKNPKSNPETDGPTPLFGPIKWANDAGIYEPGKLAEAEKAKLPADAVAIVQQMLLWNPTDTGLYWLLAELYAVEGTLRQSAVIFDQCAWSRQFSNRKVLMAHREALNAAVAKLPPEKASDEQIIGGDKPPSPEGENGLPPMRNVVFAAVIIVPIVLVLLVLQLRKWLRK